MTKAWKIQNNGKANQNSLSFFYAPLQRFLAGLKTLVANARGFILTMGGEAMKYPNRSTATLEEIFELNTQIKQEEERRIKEDARRFRAKVEWDLAVAFSKVGA